MAVWKTGNHSFLKTLFVDFIILKIFFLKIAKPITSFCVLDSHAKPSICASKAEHHVDSRFGILIALTSTCLLWNFHEKLTKTQICCVIGLCLLQHSNVVTTRADCDDSLWLWWGEKQQKQNTDLWHLPAHSSFWQKLIICKSWPCHSNYERNVLLDVNMHALLQQSLPASSSVCRNLLNQQSFWSHKIEAKACQPGSN